MTDFRLLRAFNDERLRGYSGTRTRIGRNALPHFAGDSLAERLVRELAHERALPIKEVAESFEFFQVVRKYLRRTPTVVDLCSGHGLAGILFAAFERRTEEVVLCDRRRPQHFERVRRACLRAAPWIADKVRYVEGDLDVARSSLAADSAVIGVHACGRLTDDCIAIALALGGPFAVMPCCRDQSMSTAPQGLAQALGADVAYDVERTYEIERAGFRVRWRAIPEAITPMNRVLIAVPRAGVATTA
jgi:hypothetical protein